MVYHTGAYTQSIVMTTVFVVCLLLGSLLCVLYGCVPLCTRWLEPRCLAGMDTVRFKKNKYTVNMSIALGCSVVALSAMCISIYTCSMDATAGFRSLPGLVDDVGSTWDVLTVSQAYALIATDEVSTMTDPSLGDIDIVESCPNMHKNNTDLMEINRLSLIAIDEEIRAANASQCFINAVPKSWNDEMETWKLVWDFSNLSYSIVVIVVLVSVWFPWSQQKNTRLKVILPVASVFALASWGMLVGLSLAGSDVCQAPESFLIERMQRNCGRSAAVNLEYFLTCNSQYETEDTPHTDVFSMTRSAYIQATLCGNMTEATNYVIVQANPLPPPRDQPKECEVASDAFRAHVESMSNSVRYTSVLLTTCSRYAPNYYRYLSVGCQGVVLPITYMTLFHLITMLAVVVLIGVKPTHKSWRGEQERARENDLKRLAEVVALADSHGEGYEGDYADYAGGIN
jgi:hypothetical protein